MRSTADNAVSFRRAGDVSPLIPLQQSGDSRPPLAMVANPLRQRYCSSMSHPNARPYIWMLCGSFSFTLMGVLAHVLLQSNRTCDWQTVAVFRAGIVAALAAAIALATGVKLVFWPWRLWLRSVSGSCSMLCTFYAFDKLPVADVFTLTNTFPIWVALLSWPLYGQSPGLKVLGAVMVGVVGVALVEQPHFASGNFGVLAALAAAGFTAVAMLGLHSLSNLAPLAVVAHFSAVATGFCLVAAVATPLEHDPMAVAQPRVALELLGMGLAALVGQLFLTLAFSHGAPAKVSVVGLTQIVFGLGFGICLFNHEVNWLTLVGTVLVIAPTAWLLSRPADHSPASGGRESPGSSQHSDSSEQPGDSRPPLAKSSSP
ncbi:MAG: EamA/RhaT family transporter [Planctomycetaceae bacterium]|nr:EamA/RhaT family transporter [Planctomycetaceae bacterium]